MNFSHATSGVGNLPQTASNSQTSDGKSTEMRLYFAPNDLLGVLAEVHCQSGCKLIAKTAVIEQVPVQMTP